MHPRPAGTSVMADSHAGHDALASVLDYVTDNPAGMRGDSANLTAHSIGFESDFVITFGRDSFIDVGIDLGIGRGRDPSLRGTPP